MSGTEARDSLRRENESLRARLDEAEATLHALRTGEVDAVLVHAGREQVLTLETPEKTYRLLIEQMPHPAATLSADGAILYANHALQELLSRPLHALIGASFADFVIGESRPAFEDLVRAGCAGDTQAEITLRRDDGTSLEVFFGARPLQEGALGECVVLTDLTTQRHYDELRRTQKALRASEGELREADRKKDEFLAMLAHELRNPLLPMRNALEIIKAKGPQQQELEWARGVLDRQVRLMARLLDDLLDVAGISRNTLDLRMERVNLAGVLDAALEISGPLIEAGSHELVLRLPSEPIYLHADPVRLSQVFSNILSNAAKYTETGGRIEVVAGRDDGHVIVSIKDTGIGIPPEMLPRIFEIFTQAKQAIVRAQGGLGIGLSLVKGLVELHGGSVVAKSAGTGRGSEFIVRLPVHHEASANA